MKVEQLPLKYAKLLASDPLVQGSSSQQACRLSTWLVDQGKQLTGSQQNALGPGAADATAMAAVKQALQQQTCAVQEAVACMEDYVSGPQDPEDRVLPLYRQQPSAKLAPALQGDKVTSRR